MKEFSNPSRGQSEPVGVILLLAIVIVSLGALGVLGANSFETSKAGVDLEIAEYEMSTLANEIETVASDQTPVRTVSLEFDAAGSQGTTIVDEDRGRISVDIGGEKIHSGNLGVVEYENAGVRIAYQGGGVWRQNPGGDSHVIQEPSFGLENHSVATLTIPLVVVHGIDGISGRTEITYDETNRMYPSIIVPKGDSVVITIESRYNEAWDQYFIETLGIDSETVIQDDNASNSVAIIDGEEELYLHFTIHNVNVSSK